MARDGDAASTAETFVTTARTILEDCVRLFLVASLTILRSLSYDHFPLHPSFHFVKPSLLLFYKPPLVQMDCRGDGIGPFSISASRVTAPCLAHTSPVAPSRSAISVLSYCCYPMSVFCLYPCAVPQHVCWSC